MWTWWLLAWSLGQVVMFRPATGDIRLSPCGLDKTAEVIQGRNTTFTCSGLPHEKAMSWHVKSEMAVSPYLVGSCGSRGGECSQADLGKAFMPSRRSETETVVVVDPTQLNNKGLLKTGALECSAEGEGAAAGCQMDYVVPAQGTCRITAGTGRSRFMLDAHCTLQPGARSTRGRYTCEWHQHGETSQNWSVPLTNNRTECRKGRPLPTTTGHYTYIVTLLPGRATLTAGSLDIVKPAPTMSNCDGDSYQPENKTLTCTCGTATIGQPPGRLRWLEQGSDGVTVLKNGSYGDGRLTLSLTMHRSSDQRPKSYRCDVEWTETIRGHAVNFSVGYPPTQAVLDLNDRPENLTVKESEPITFRCYHSNGLPSPSVGLVKLDNGTVLVNATSDLRHVVMGRCEDSGQYVCAADNGMGPPMTGSPLWLAVSCSPRGKCDLGEVNFIDDPVSLTFDVTAYPVPDKVTFAYLGLMSCDAEESDIDDSLIQIKGECGPRPGVAYLATCTLTVTNVTMDTAEGFYQVTVNNAVGSGLFRFRVRYKASTPSGAESGSPSYFSVAVSTCVALVVIVVIIIVVVIWLWRRQWHLPCAGVSPLSNIVLSLFRRPKIPKNLTIIARWKLKRAGSICTHR
ncbi:uncharacterized protein LOC143291572 isoform X2 [Babylonia areolata]|uniref:uncharacterized protein LOC143291572 isoform X2 n=1 Tax=Babylonia areolata TaxID=304850 RepID=UPI003FD1BED2